MRKVWNVNVWVYDGSGVITETVNITFHNVYNTGGRTMHIHSYRYNIEIEEIIIMVLFQCETISPRIYIYRYKVYACPAAAKLSSRLPFPVSIRFVHAYSVKFYLSLYTYIPYRSVLACNPPRETLRCIKTVCAQRRKRCVLTTLGRLLLFYGLPHETAFYCRFETRTRWKYILYSYTMAWSVSYILA